MDTQEELRTLLTYSFSCLYFYHYYYRYGMPRTGGA